MTDVKTKILGSVISVSKGKKHLVVDAPSSSSKRLLGIDDLRNDNLLRYTDDQSGTSVFPSDVLIAWDGANAGTIGYGKAGYIGSTIARLRISEKEKIFTPFLGTFLKSKFDYLRQTATGATIPHINRKALDDIELPDIDFQDQIRIAHLLGKVEGLIAQRKENLQQLSDLVKSVFLEMFGDPVRNEKGWDMPDFEEIISSMRNGLSPSKTGVEKGNVYTLSAITGDHFREIFKEDIFSQIHDKYYPAVNDFLVCRGNGNIELVGRGHFSPGISEGIIFPDTIIAVSIRPNAVNKHFFEALWKTRFIRQQIEANARTTNGAHKINQGVIEKIKIIQPPAALQDQFAGIVKKIEGIKSSYQQSLTDFEALYGALSQKAFKGKLDLSKVPLINEAAKEKSEDIFISRQAEASKSFRVNEYVNISNLISKVNLDPPRKHIELQGIPESWLEAYLSYADSNSKKIDMKLFLQVCTEKWGEMFQFSSTITAVDSYEKIKNRIFEKLRNTELLQQYDEEKLSISLKGSAKGI